MLMSQLS